MKTKTVIAALLTLTTLLTCSLARAETKELVSWPFDSQDAAAGWGRCGLSESKIVDGALCADYTGRDPFLITPHFEFAPRAGQYIELRIKTVSRGKGEIFFADSDAGPNGGFSQERTATWDIIHDGQWHTYRVFPNWSKQPKIIKLRIDFGIPDELSFGKESVAVDYIKIVDLDLAEMPAVTPDWTFNAETTGWTVENGSVEKGNDGWTVRSDAQKRLGADYFESSVQSGAGVAAAPPAVSLSSDFFAADLTAETGWVAVTMKTSGSGAILSYASSRTTGVVSFPFDTEKSDGFVTYNLRMSDNKNVKNWSGKLFYLAVAPIGGDATIQRISVGREPVGDARIVLVDLGLTEAFNRAGSALPLTVTLKNLGGRSAENLSLRFDDLPEGMTIAETADGANALKEIALGALVPFDTLDKTLYLTSAKPFVGAISYTISADGAPARQGAFDANIVESLGLAKADYVPEPEAVKTLDPELEIGALYFPGWATRAAWERIRPVAPIRKPVLGWYDEGNPEVVDWQIKWAREAGISFFLVDWYWNRGRISLEHWIKAFQKAKYRSQFKWAMMWANHNGAGSHSVEDQTAVTKYWIENYFNTPEYYTIDGKPVVMIWSAEGMDNDLRKIEQETNGSELEKGEGVKILLDLSRKMAVEAGYPGIYFIAMKWPESSTQAKDIEWLAKAGFDMTSIYHYMNPGQKTENPRLFDFDLIVKSSPPWWRERNATGILPYLPNLSTGWDDRPWNNHLVIANRTPEKFRKICEEMKTYLAESGQKRICIAPLNEWGEGSYAEPNREFGFKMYEALRETFCEKPAGGWPLYYGPSDVGLGPYDYPKTEQAVETAWKFDGEQTSWRTIMGFDGFTLADGVLKAATVTKDPAMFVSTAKLPAADFTKFRFRMKLTPQDGQTKQGAAQLFWSTLLAPICEAQSLHIPVVADGEFHDYEIDLTRSPLWKNRITSLRFDPISAADCALEIESFAFE